MKYLKLFAIATVMMLLNASAQAITIDSEEYCSLKVQDGREVYNILVPRPNVKSINEQLNVIGINCRNENK